MLESSFFESFFMVLVLLTHLTNNTTHAIIDQSVESLSSSFKLITPPTSTAAKYNIH